MKEKCKIRGLPLQVPTWRGSEKKVQDSKNAFEGFEQLFFRDLNIHCHWNLVRKVFPVRMDFPWISHKVRISNLVQNVHYSMKMLYRLHQTFGILPTLAATLRTWRELDDPSRYRVGTKFTPERKTINTAMYMYVHRRKLQLPSFAYWKFYICCYLTKRNKFSSVFLR